jgi:hypothetical protein
VSITGVTAPIVRPVILKGKVFTRLVAELAIIGGSLLGRMDIRLLHIAMVRLTRDTLEMCHNLAALDRID